MIFVSSLFTKSYFPRDVPYYAEIVNDALETLANGGFGIGVPEGAGLVMPVLHAAGLIIETLDFNRVREKRQNFNVVGNYLRPDVTKLQVK